MDELADWIAHDQSDFAQCVREAVAPTIAELSALLRRLEVFEPKYDRWVVTMNPKVYSRLLPMSRRKLQPYVRKAWRSHDPA